MGQQPFTWRLCIRYHLRPAIRYYLSGITPLSVVGALAIAGLCAVVYEGYFARVQRGMVAVTLLELRAATAALVVVFLVWGLRRRRGMVTFWASTPSPPAEALRALLLINGGRLVTAGLSVYALVYPFAVWLSPSPARALLHLASDAILVLLHYLAAGVIAVLWHRRRAGGAVAAAAFGAVVGAELLLFGTWPEADLLLLAVNVAIGLGCWGALIGRLDAAALQRYLGARGETRLHSSGDASRLPGSAVSASGGRSAPSRLISALPLAARLYLKAFLLRRETALAVVAALALFAGLLAALIAGLPDDQRSAIIVLCMYFAAVSAGSVLGAFDRTQVLFFKTTPVSFRRLSVSVLAPHCTMYLLAAAVAAAIGVAGGMRAGALFVLLTQGVFLAVLAWLIPFRFLYSWKVFALIVSGMIMAGGLVLALGSTAPDGGAGPLLYAGYVLIIPAILYPGASYKYRDTTLEDWTPAP